MTIEIRRPELEALIRERMESGEFQTVEDVLLQALKSSALPPEGQPRERTGADLVAALQSSPYKDVDLQPMRAHLPVRDVLF